LLLGGEVIGTSLLETAESGGKFAQSYMGCIGVRGILPQNFADGSRPERIELDMRRQHKPIVPLGSVSNEQRKQDRQGRLERNRKETVMPCVE